MHIVCIPMVLNHLVCPIARTVALKLFKHKSFMYSVSHLCVCSVAN